VGRNLIRQSYTVEEKPKIQTEAGLRKPDIVAKMGRTLVVLDAVNDQVSLDEAHQRKIKYYKSMNNTLRNKYEVTEIRFGSITLSWRGVWSAESANDLLTLGVVKKKELKILSTRAITGGLASFHIFNRSTIHRTSR